MGDPIHYIHRLVKLANVAYSKSGIPLRIHAHCIEQLNPHTNFTESLYTMSESRLEGFTWAKGVNNKVMIFFLNSRQYF
jgi:hypothetical protein